MLKELHYNNRGFKHPNWNDWYTIHNIKHSEFSFLKCLRDNFHQLIEQPKGHQHGQNSNILDLQIVDKPELVESIEYMYSKICVKWSLKNRQNKDLKGIYYCLIEIIKGLADKGQFQYLTN